MKIISPGKDKNLNPCLLELEGYLGFMKITSDKGEVLYIPLDELKAAVKVIK